MSLRGNGLQENEALYETGGTGEGHHIGSRSMGEETPDSKLLQVIPVNTGEVGHHGRAEVNADRVGVSRRNSKRTPEVDKQETTRWREIFPMGEGLFACPHFFIWVPDGLFGIPSS